MARGKEVLLAVLDGLSYDYLVQDSDRAEGIVYACHRFALSQAVTDLTSAISQRSANTQALDLNGERPVDQSFDEADLPAEWAPFVVQAFEDSPGRWNDRDLLAVALAYDRSRQPDRAEKIYGRLVTASDNVRALRRYARFLIRSERDEQAIEPLDSAWRSGRDLGALVDLVFVYNRVGRYEKAYALTPILLHYKFAGDGDAFRALLQYCVGEPDAQRAEEVLLKAFAGLSFAFLVRDGPMTNTSISLLERHGRDGDAERLRVALKERVERGKSLGLGQFD